MNLDDIELAFSLAQNFRQPIREIGGMKTRDRSRGRKDIFLNRQVTSCPRPRSAWAVLCTTFATPPSGWPEDSVAIAILIYPALPFRAITK